jgi:integrase
MSTTPYYHLPAGHLGRRTGSSVTTTNSSSTRPSTTPCGLLATGRGLIRPELKPVAPHDLRHSCAGLLFAAGVPVPKVAAILRHADPRITLSTYAGLVESQRAELRGDPEAALS